MKGKANMQQQTGAPTLLQSQRQFSDAIGNTLITKSHRRFRFFGRKSEISAQLLPPNVNPSPIFESSFNLGLATALEGDRFSFLDRKELGSTVASGVSIIQDQLGAQANEAYAFGKNKIGSAETNVRASAQKLPIWLFTLIVFATVVIDSVAAHNALSIVWNATEIITWGAAVAIALLLAIAGWIIAITSVNLFGRIALWIGLVLTVISVLAVGWTAAELRGIQQSKESVQSEIIDLKESLSLIDDGTSTSAAQTRSLLENAQLQERELANSFDTYVLYFYAGLILFTVSVASLAKAYESLQQNQTYDRRTTKRQFERGNSLAIAEGVLESLESWLPVSQSIDELGKMAIARYIDGFRKGLSPEQLDHFIQNPPQFAVIGEAKWTQEFKEKIDKQRLLLEVYKDDLHLPKTT
jgi:hypothetical protein